MQTMNSDLELSLAQSSPIQMFVSSKITFQEHFCVSSRHWQREAELVRQERVCPSPVLEQRARVWVPGDRGELFIKGRLSINHPIAAHLCLPLTVIPQQTGPKQMGVGNAAATPGRRVGAHRLPELR